MNQQQQHKKVHSDFSLNTKVDLTVDEGKERLNPSGEKNEGKHRRRKVDEKLVTLFLRDPGWYVHKPDVQNRPENTHTHIIHSTLLAVQVS